MQLQDYLRILRKRWRWVIGSGLLCVLAAATLTLLATPQYQARAEIFVAPGVVTTTGELAQGSTFAQNRVKSYVQVITSDLVLGPVVAELGLPGTSGALATRVSASVPTDTVLIDITVTDSSPEQAATIANAIAERFRSVASSIEPARADASESVTITLIQPAVAPASASSPNLVVNVALGALVGLLGGLALAAIREILDTRLKGERDIPAVTALPVLGRLPFDALAARQPLVLQAGADRPRAEALRQLRTNLQFVATGGAGRSLLFTSSVPGEGKSTVVLNLAIALTQAGSTVCLVEADLRRPSLGGYLGLDDTVGLTSVLIDAAKLSDVVQRWGDHQLDVILSGERPPNPSELLGGDAMTVLLATLARRYDYVLLDSPPLLPVTDSVVLARQCSGVLMVVGTGTVRRRELHRSLADLEGVEARVLGLVLNRLPVKGPNSTGIAHYRYKPETTVGAAPGRRLNRGGAFRDNQPREPRTGRRHGRDQLGAGERSTARD